MACRGRILDDWIIREVLRLRRASVPILQIAMRLSLSRTTVYKTLRQHKLTTSSAT